MNRIVSVATLFFLCVPGMPGIGTRAFGGTTGIQTIYVVHTSHWDYGFTDPPQNLPGLIRTHINDAVAKCQTDARKRYTIEHTWALEDYLSAATQPEIDALMDLIRAGRIAVGSGYSGPHSGIMSAEELNRWIYRNKKLRDQYQISSRAAHCDDNPGYTWAMADALSGAGVDRLVVGQNNTFGGTIPLTRDDSIFRWQGPGGGQVLTWVSRDGYTEGFDKWHVDANTARLFVGSQHPEWAGMTNLQIMEQGITAQVDLLESSGYAYDSVLVIEAFDKMNFDPSGQLQSDIDAWNATHTTPKIKLATADEFFDHMVATYGLDAFPVYSGNFTFRWEEPKVSGQTSQARFRETRDTIPAAELFASVASQFGTPYPTAPLDVAMRELMRYDDHGAGAGGTFPNEMTLAEVNQTNLHWTQNSLARRDEVRAALASSAAAVASRIATTPGPNPEIVVFNPLSSERTDLTTATVATGGQPFALRDAVTGAAVRYQTQSDGSIQFVAESVPPLGYKRYRVLLGTTDSWTPGSAVTATSIENAFYRVTISPQTGAITSIVDKAAGSRELVNASARFPFNRTVRASNQVLFFGLSPRTIPHGSASTATSSGPVSGTLAINYTPSPNGSPLSRVEIRLYDQLKRIDIVDTHDRSRLLYQVPLSDTSEHFYTPLPFAISTANLQPIVDGNAASPLRPPTATYLAGPSAVANNNAHFASRGITLRDTAASYDVQVVSPEVFNYYIGTSLSTTYGPAEATLLGQVMDKMDRTQTDDPGDPDVSFILEPLENNPSQGYQVFTSRFAVTSGPARADSASGAFGASVCAPMPTVVVPGGQPGAFAGAALSFFSVAAPNVEVIAVKRPDFGDPAETIVRVRERDGLATNTSLHSAFAVLAASECTLLEQPTAPLATSPVPVALGPYQTKTIRLRLGSLAAQERDTAGIYVPSSGAWFLRNTNSPGPADVTAIYGPPSLVPVAGDWNGDGVDSLGVFNATTSTFFLKNVATGGPADVVAGFGPPNAGSIPIVGDWNGDGVDTVGIYAPGTGAFFLRQANAPGPADLTFTFGGPGAVPIVGDWNGDGVDTVGIYVPASGAFFLKNTNASGPADVVLVFGGGGATPIAGDWNGDGVDTVGIYVPASGAFFLKNTNASGPADVTFIYGPPNATPVTGNWDGQ
jgi:hypothetical protein